MVREYVVGIGVCRGRNPQGNVKIISPPKCTSKERQKLALDYYNYVTIVLRICYTSAGRRPDGSPYLRRSLPSFLR